MHIDKIEQLQILYMIDLYPAFMVYTLENCPNTIMATMLKCYWIDDS